MIHIVDYGMGNVGSIRSMLRRLGVQSKLASDADVLAGATKAILPGVGTFDAGMESIEARGLREVLDRKATMDRIPILGICLGAQLMTLSSEEGKRPGLGWIRARAFRFPPDAENRLKVPHMGWNDVRVSRPSALTSGLMTDSRFYFVHSYFIRVESDENRMLTTSYGVEFDSGIQADNLFGVQFHPEKSHRFGMGLLARFAEL